MIHQKTKKCPPCIPERGGRDSLLESYEQSPKCRAGRDLFVVTEPENLSKLRPDVYKILQPLERLGKRAYTGGKKIQSFSASGFRKVIRTCTRPRLEHRKRPRRRGKCISRIHSASISVCGLRPCVRSGRRRANLPKRAGAIASSYSGCVFRGISIV